MVGKKGITQYCKILSKKDFVLKVSLSKDEELKSKPLRYVIKLNGNIAFIGYAKEANVFLKGIDTGCSRKVANSDYYDCWFDGDGKPKNEYLRT